MVLAVSAAGAADLPQNLFPRVDQASFTDNQQPQWLHGDLGRIERGDIDAATSNYIDDRRSQFGLVSTDEIKVVRSLKDTQGITHVRIHQTHFDLPVEGADAWLHIGHDGRVETINGYLAGDILQMPVPDLTAKAAFSILRDNLGATNIRLLEAPALVYRASPNTETRLAWKILVEGKTRQEAFQDRVYVDAETGAILARIGMLQDALYRKIYDGNNTTSMPGTLMFVEGGSSSDAVAMAAYNNTGTTYNFYNTVFGRDSYDGSGTQIPSTVHHLFDMGGGQTTKNNAAWSDYYKTFMFGDGDGTSFIPLSYSLDVTAHELTHAVTSSTADLEYQNESGAVNEAMSDIFGVACEAWDDGGVNADTWKMGEDVYTPGTSGDALRYINDPAADGSSPDYYPDRYTGTSDYGGVHINMGIGSLAFYLLSEGGSHPRGKTTNTVTGVGITKAEAIFYRALTQYLTSTSNFESARNATAQAATDLYGSAETASVHAAWDAVGVPGGGSTGGDTEIFNGDSLGNLGASTGGELHFFISVPSGATNLALATSGGSGDGDLYVRFGAKPTTSSYDYRPYLNGNAESVSVASPSAGTWYVMIRAYSTFSGVTLTASYDTAASNAAPNASFTVSTADLVASFTDTSTDSDGSIASRSWNFGDGGSSSVANPSHTYGSAGTYTVTLTVTDNDGATDSYSASVTVTAPASGPTELTNGSTVSNLSASTGQELDFTMEVPSGASNLVFTMSGGTGDADIYVRFGAAPTTSTYDYRPYKTGNNETVEVSTATAGTWYVMIRAYSGFSGVSLVGSYDTGTGGGTQTASVSGSVDGKGEKLYNLTVSGGTIDLSLTWDNTNDLDLYLYNPSGTEVAKGISTSKPETLSYDTGGASGTYQIKVYNYSSSGTANFTLTADYQP
jgi:vibriolysin